MTAGMRGDRLAMMALAVEIMEAMYREGHTVRSALAELHASPKPGRGATWEDVTGRVLELLRGDLDGHDLLAPWRGQDTAPELPPRPSQPYREHLEAPQYCPPVGAPKVVTFRKPSKAVKRPSPDIQRATKVDGPVVIDEAALERMRRRA